MYLIILGIFIFFSVITFIIIWKSLHKNADDILTQEQILEITQSELKNVSSEITRNQVINKFNFNDISTKFKYDSNSINTRVGSLTTDFNNKNNMFNSNISYQENTLSNLSYYVYNQSNLFKGKNITGSEYNLNNSSYYFNSNNLNTNSVLTNSLSLSNNNIYTSNNRLSVDLKGDVMEIKTGSGLKASFIHDAFGNTSINGGLVTLGMSVVNSNTAGIYTSNLLGFVNGLDVSGVVSDDTTKNLTVFALNKSVNINGALYTSNNDIVIAGKLYTNNISLKDNQQICIGSNCLTNKNNSISTPSLDANNLCTNNVCWSNLNGAMYTSSPITFSNQMNLSGDFYLNNGSLCIDNTCITSADLIALKSNASI
jgi:hypothetical protein